MDSRESEFLNMQNKRINHFILLGVFVVLLLQSSFSRASWFGEAKEGVKSLTNTIKASIQGNDSGVEDETTKSEKALASQSYSYPEKWTNRVLVEPVFGSEIHVVETGQSNQQVVLLIHGLGKVGSQDWLKVIPALEDKYHVIAFDLPGFGNSGRPAGRYSPTHYAELTAWLVDNYIQNPVTLVGHSMGGAVALRFAASYPEKVEKLIMADTAGILERTAFLKHVGKIPLDTNVDSTALQKLGTQLLDLGGSVVELSALTPDPTPLLQKSEKMWSMAFTKNPNGNAALALIVEDFGEAIKSMGVKTYIIWGEDDPVAPLRTGRVLAGRMPDASMQVIEGAGHVPMNSHSETFNRLLIAALNDNWPKAVEQHGANGNTGKLVCDNEVGKTYSGHYQSVDITRCTGVKLWNLTADKLRVTDSVIEVVNSRISSDSVAVKTKESVLTVTNSTFAGRIAVKASGSRLDLAGVSLSGKDNAIQIETGSRIIFSVSDIQSSTYTGNVHGVFTAEDTYLDRTIKRDYK